MPSTLETKLTGLSNKIKQLVNTKANKTDGASEITDSDSDDYTNIATMQSGATQATINDAINIKLGNVVEKSLTTGLLKNDGTVDTNTYLQSGFSLSDGNKNVVTDSNGGLTVEEKNNHTHTGYLIKKFEEIFSVETYNNDDKYYELSGSHLSSNDKVVIGENLQTGFSYIGYSYHDNEGDEWVYIDSSWYGFYNDIGVNDFSEQIMSNLTNIFPMKIWKVSSDYINNFNKNYEYMDLIENDSNFIYLGELNINKPLSYNLTTVAFSGSYDDLKDKPTIPTDTSDLTNGAGFLTSHQDISGKANTSDLATVATTGDYDDLIDKPTIPPKNLFHGICSTSASTQTKVVTTNNWTWGIGDILVVSFSNANTYNGTPNIQIGNTTKPVSFAGNETQGQYFWRGNSAITFVYTGSAFLMVNQGKALTSGDGQNYYGLTRFKDILDFIYPVGSIYMSVNSTSPETLFGGTWVAIEERFLLASKQSATSGLYQPGKTDGSADAVVVSHNHTQNSHTHTQNSHNHKPTNDSYNFVASEDGMNLLMGGSKQITTGSGYHYMYATTSKGVAEYDHTGDATPTINGQTATNQSEGVDGTGKNMPPYLAVYMWKRTA